MDPSRVEGREINLHIISLLREAHKSRRQTLAMGKNQRKRSRPTASTDSGAWKSVSVTLPGGENDAEHQANDVENIEMSKEYSRNHYDDPKLSRKAQLDLPMDPGEDCGMFFGLEVLDASQYRVENTGSHKRLIVMGEDNNGASPDGTEKSKSKKESTKSSSIESEKESAEKDDSSEPKKKKQKKKKDKKKKNGQDEKEVGTKESIQKPQEQEPVTPEQLARIQLSWSAASGGAHLHDKLLESLHRLGFASPTPIQAATLSASTLGRRNLVGAAPTGSGKTLAFLLPILNNMLQKQDEETDDSASEKKVQALIMTPTRGKLCLVISKMTWKKFLSTMTNIRLHSFEFPSMQG